ncbi:DinB family protein [Actinokineospora inagensis]|uniref:DinB family protein n=1 Tax=Actinokineospora inagensis TaxID=103730 RepID=UPI0003FA4C2B|nr:DinB family protein [Actinokineospora inagensis]
MTDSRTEPHPLGGEREQLTGFLDFLRETVVRKATGLSEADAHRALLPTSPLMTVAGLLSHLRWVEVYWFVNALSGEPTPAPFPPGDVDGPFRVGVDLTLDQAIAEYTAQCAHSREVVARRELDDSLEFDGWPLSVRWVLLHMVEETGRHAGHLDVIREMLDGVTGE